MASSNSEDAFEDASPSCQAPHEEEGMVVQPACTCPSCEHWTKSADWSQPSHISFGTEATPKVTVTKKYQPLISTERVEKTHKILSYNPQNVAKVEKAASLKTLVHGEVIPRPAKTLTETYFNKDIQRSLEDLNYRHSLPCQSFVWPAIFRKLNVFMIGSPHSGKTLAYLPALCTFSTMEDERFSKHKGPLVIIVCSNSRQCEEIMDLINVLYQHIRQKPKVAIITYPVVKMSSMDILLTIPNSLVECLKSRFFNLKRLCHLAIEDASVTLQNDCMEKIFSVINSMLEHRPNNVQVQLIVSSLRWTPDLEKLLHLVFVTPLVCINNHLEAAFYGKIQLEIKFLMSVEKQQYLRKILTEKYTTCKTVVICDESEILEVSKSLARDGIETISLSEASSKEDLEECELEWSYAPGGRYKVLVCTDYVFQSHLCINDAMCLVNYSLPCTWTRFHKRFRALSSYFRSPLDSNKDETQPKSYLIVDETCESQMSKILDLLSRLPKSLPLVYEQYAKGFREQAEKNKLNDRVPLCERLKLFGKCSEFCEKRHTIKQDVSPELPTSGRLKFKILNIKDVTHYAVQILEHIDTNNTVWTISNDDLKQPLCYDVDEDILPVADVKLGSYCALRESTTKGETYTLCHVVKSDGNKVDVLLATEVPVQARREMLFKLPAHLKVANVILCDLKPPFKDRFFSGKSYQATRSSLEKMNYKSMVLTGRIFLQAEETFWLSDVSQRFTVDGTEVIKFNLPQHLIKMMVVQASKTQTSGLEELCEKCGLHLPKRAKTKGKTLLKQEMVVQEAFLDDNINDVTLISAISPEEFYVRLAKFEPLLDSLETELKQAVERGILEKKMDIEIGKYYLCPSHGAYSRVKVLNAEGEKILVFFVDYGDEAVVDLSSLKVLPTQYLTRLPFQAIECRLYGCVPPSDRWSDASTDLLYKYMLLEDERFRPFYVEVRSKDVENATRCKVKYSVLMKDGWEENHLMINQLLLDCGLASSIFDKFDDFEIPQPPPVREDDSDSESERLEETLEDFQVDDFECEIFDPMAMLKALGFEQSPITQTQPQQAQAQDKSPIRELNDSSLTERKDYLTPEVFWSQTETTVKIKVKLIGVEEYKVNIVRNRIFCFYTKLEDKSYRLNFTLHRTGKINKHCAHGLEVVIHLYKTEAGAWTQLTSLLNRPRYIHYELGKEVEKVKRKFLQLDMTDEESEGEADILYHEVSDLDSEFDQDLSSSDDD